MTPTFNAAEHAKTEITRLELELKQKTENIERESARIEVIKVQIEALKPLAAKAPAPSK